MPGIRAFRNIWFLLLAILTIVLAVGANVVVFTIINAIWLRPPSIHEPERVVVFRSHGLGGAGAGDAGTWGAMVPRAFRDTGAFEGVAAQLRGPQTGVLTHLSLGRAAGLTAAGVTPDYFRVLGVPIAGRDFRSQDDAPGAPPVAIVSHRVWQQQMGGRIEAVGAVVDANRAPLMIVGVASQGFHGAIRGEETDVWLPSHTLLRLSGTVKPPSNLQMTVFCRLPPGMSLFDARVALASLGRGLENRVDVVPVSRLFGSVDGPIIVLEPERIVVLAAMASLLVLCGGCATLMALLLVHYERRRRELSIRLALGATRGALIRQLSRELMVVVIMGSVGALAAAWGALNVLPAFKLPGGVDFGRLALTFDWPVIAAALIVCVMTLLVAVLVPIRRFTNPGMAGSLVTAGASASRSSLNVRRAILTVHTAVTVLVLLAAALLAQSAAYGLTAAGFDTEHTLFITVALNQPPAEDRALDASQTHGRRLWADSRVLMQDIRAVPGVATVALGPPPLGSDADQFIDVARDVDTDTGLFHLPVSFRPVGADYLAAIGAPVVVGQSGTGDGAVVTSALAGQLWPGESPIGRPLRLNAFFYDGVVSGVVDLAFGSLRRQRPHVVFVPNLETYMPARLEGSGILQLVVNSADPDGIRSQIGRLIRRSLPTTSRITMTSGREVLDSDLGREQLGAWLFSGFGLVGLILGAGGVFGLVGYQVTSRRPEFGVMLALGSGHRRVIRKALLIGLEPAVIGAAVGVIAALLSAGTLEAFLLGASGFDLKTYAAVVGFFVATAGLAAWLAAWPLRVLSPRDAMSQIAD
jgi:predicted permease